MKYVPSFPSLSNHVNVMSSDLMKKTQLSFSFIQQKTILVAIAIFSCCALFFSFCRHHFNARQSKEPEVDLFPAHNPMKIEELIKKHTSFLDDNGNELQEADNGDELQEADLEPDPFNRLTFNTKKTPYLQKNSTFLDAEEEAEQDYDLPPPVELIEQESDVRLNSEQIDDEKKWVTQPSSTELLTSGKRSIFTRLVDNRKDAHQQQQEGYDNYRFADYTLPTNGSFRSEWATITGSTPFPGVGVSSAQGYRDTMEDEDIAIEGSIHIQGDCVPFKLFGVFDGHGGAGASKFVKEHIEQYLKAKMSHYNENGLTEEGIFRALKECFVALDADLPLEVDGTTATVAFVIEEKIWVANVGDSRTIIVKQGGETIQASEDAKPNMPTYRKTIEKLNGRVFQGRVMANLAVARAIGDKSIVGFNKDGTFNNQCCVSPKPKITCFPLQEVVGGHLVLACDGLYDVASTNQVGEAISQMIGLDYTPEEMSGSLVDRALYSGSRDNVTVLVVKV